MEHILLSRNSEFRAWNLQKAVFSSGYGKVVKVGVQMTIWGSLQTFFKPCTVKYIVRDKKNHNFKQP